MNDNEKTKKGLWEWITMLLNITNLILIVFILYKMPKNAKSNKPVYEKDEIISVAHQD